MHRLRTFRKAKEEDESIPPVPTPSSSHKGFKWGKNSSPPPKQPELDLQHVLPPTDDFRTSLLMPNLAQRFSILQMEQAAAAAAAAAAAGGKVSGESFVVSGVVEGKDGFAYAPPVFTPLGDIAETSSIIGSTIGATAQQNRLTTKSEESSNSEQDGSIMNRSRGGEGNVLFGGRQKIYRVPTGVYRVGSSEDLPGRSASPMGGRVVYDHDVTDLAFSKLRKGSQEQEASIDGSGDYNRNRYTSSSTNSTPTTTTRSSTAATSLASNTNSVSIPTSASTSSLPNLGSGPMASSKPRRPLYEQALDQQLQDHQNSAVGRLERLASIRKLGTTSPPMTNYAGGNNFQSGQLHTSSTSPTSIHNKNQWPRKRPDSPLSPPEEVVHEEEERTEEFGVRKQDPVVLSRNLGTFNFGLEPVSRTPVSPPVSASVLEFPTQRPFRPGNQPGEQTRRESPEKAVSPPPEEERISLGGQRGRRLSRDEGRAETHARLSMRSSSSSSESNYDDESGDNHEGRGRNVVPLQLAKQPTVSMSQSPESVSPVSPISPASNHEDTSDKSVSPDPLPLRNPAILPASPRFSDMNFTADDDSPTLPPAQGLGVLVRQHLRSDSGHSSMYAGSTYTRVSRNSRYGASNGKQPSVGGTGKVSSGSGTARPSGASGSSGGNLWEFDDWDGADYGDDENGPPSPSTISDSQGITAPPLIPQKAPGRTPTMSGLRSGDGGQEVDDWNKQRELVASRAGERERNITSEEDEQDKDWEQQLAFRRQIIQQNLRNQEKVNSQHDMSFPPLDFKEGSPRINGPGFNILKSKSSNGFLAKGDATKGPKAPGVEPSINGPPMRPDGRGRMMYDEERMLRDAVRGPHNMPPPHYHPMHQPAYHPPPHHPRQFQGQQTLATGPPYNRHPYGERPPLGLPHPLHSPMHTPRMRPRPSQEQMNSVQSTPRGVPVGWRDENWGHSHSAPGTQPGTPTTPRDSRMPRKQPSMPGMGGRRDDMRQPPNQGQQFRVREDEPGHDREPRRHPGGPPPHYPPQSRPQYDALGRPGHESVETSPPPPSHDFRRPRNGSNASPAPTMRQRRGTLDSTPLPPLNTSVAVAAALAPPKQSQPSSAATPYSAISSDRSPAIVQRTPTTAGSGGPPATVVSSALANIQNSNVGFAPAKKRSVNKNQIGEPKLLSATSNIPTRALPPQDPTPPLSDPPRSVKPRSRRMTTTQNIFSGFGKNKSSEEVPAVPPPSSSHHRSDDEVERSSFTDDPPPKKSKGGKLRKSTSDGGALASRSRQQAMSRGPTVPKIQKGMVGIPAQSMDAPGGMI